MKTMKAQHMREVSVPELDKYIILDCQGGAEDIVGIVSALRLAKQYDKVVLGITCVGGRRGINGAVRDALTALQIANTKLPVYKGSKQSMLLRKDYPKCHGFSDQS